MTSAGEGDLESYRVRSLHTATSAFKPIIFDLKKEDNFNSLMDMLGGIWDALDENEKLPKQLVKELIYTFFKHPMLFIIT